ncbi:hypothetical protein [Actinopolyspora erythraea]|uniref:hypothetical protein n=1 Tax=Actinopolyspora erythraea TaxID=414996 RepID=UPI000B213FDE|nr:hypothetical protein [Actinopolyspora erythraea]
MRTRNHHEPPPEHLERFDPTEGTGELAETFAAWKQQRATYAEHHCGLGDFVTRLRFEMHERRRHRVPPPPPA